MKMAMLLLELRDAVLPCQQVGQYGFRVCNIDPHLPPSQSHILQQLL